MTPLEGAAERLLASMGGPVARGKQSEAVTQTLFDGPQRHRFSASCCELDPERDSFEALANRQYQVSVDIEAGDTARALSMKSATASELGRGSSGHTVSPPKRRRSRLVARTRRLGQPVSSSCVSLPAAGSRCSQLSMRISASHVPSRSTRTPLQSRPLSARRLRARAANSGTRSGSLSDESSINHPPSARSRARS
jgi:hypothetical protein